MNKALALCLAASLLAACHGRTAAPSASAAAALNTVPTKETIQTPAETENATQAVILEKTPTPTLIEKTQVALPAAPKQKTELEKPVFIPASATAPAQDKAVFEDEKLIDLKDRTLHPYADLTPDANTIQNAPWAYEQLKYGVYYSFIKAGTAYIRNRGLVNINGRPAYLLQTTAFSASVIDAFFKVRDINHSWLDAQDFYSLGYGQSVREGNYVRDEWLTFDYPNKQYTGQVQKKEAPRPISGTLDIKVLDMLTSLYYVRTQTLTPGTDIVFDIINREKQYPLIVKVLKKERVKTEAGTFDCVLVEPQIRGEGIFVAKGKSLKVWLTDDEYKMPVKMKVEVFIGSVSAELLEYKRQDGANIL